MNLGSEAPLPSSGQLNWLEVSRGPVVFEKSTRFKDAESQGQGAQFGWGTVYTKFLHYYLMVHSCEGEVSVL